MAYEVPAINVYLRRFIPAQETGLEERLVTSLPAGIIRIIMFRFIGRTAGRGRWNFFTDLGHLVKTGGIAYLQEKI